MLMLQMWVQTGILTASAATQTVQGGSGSSFRSSLLLETLVQAGPLVKLVLLLLILLSITCWGIILHKYLGLRKSGKASQRFLSLFSKASSLSELYQACRNMPASPLVEVFEEGYKELSRLLAPSGSPHPRGVPEEASVATKPGGIENVSRAMRMAQTRAVTDLERYLTFLASTGSTAPFIGLFGTVWGIMTAFRNIGATGSANLATVAPGIAEALIATAVGLFAAIPAVVAYNFFLQRIRVLTADMDNFSADLINIIERHLRKSP
jgi:biopolymer transport protein TolQ